MIAAVHSEVLKYRRTFTPWLVILGPLGMVFLAGIPRLFGAWGRSWPQLLAVVGNWWPVLWVPLGAALLASLAAWQESRGDAWLALRVRPVAPATLYAAKLLVLIQQALLAALLLAIFTLVVGAAFVAPGQPIPWITLLLAALLPWLAALPLLAIHLWLATAKGFGPSFGLAVAGLIAGVASAERGFWVCVPWAWPIRATIPIVGTRANGLPLDPGDPLWSTGVVPVAVVLSLGLFAVVGWASAGWFARREVR